MKSSLQKLMLLLIIATFNFNNTLFSQITLVPFTSNVFGVTDIQNCGDDRLFIVEQEGKIRISDLQGNLNTAPYLSITGRVLAGGEQGLLGLAFSPDYANDGRFYVDYTNNSGNTVISRFTVSATNPDVADSLSEEILFTVTQPFSNHNGGATFFGKDGYLYISFGDGGSGGDPGNRAQNVAEDLGKLLRINVNVPTGYSIPDDNPFYGSTVANPRIWNYGLRNAWRVNKDRLTGDIWIADVGQNLWEEVNFQPYPNAGGENYGWRCYEGNAGFNTAGCLPQSNYESPVYVYGHGPGCSITGGYVYRGAQYSPWFGKYFYTDYCDGILRTLEPNGAGGFTNINIGVFQTGVFVTFGEDKYGELYIGKTSSGVLKMTDASCLPVAYIGSQDTVTYCGPTYTFSTPASPGFLYQWSLNGSVIAGATTNSYTATQSGTYQVETVNTSFCNNTSDTIYLNLMQAPVVTLSGLPALVCENAPVVTAVGSPAGGIYSGAGINIDTFTPTLAGVGTHIITYTYDNGNGCVVSATQTIVVDACLSVPEIAANNGFFMNPNPANEYTELVFTEANPANKKIEVMDVSGRICFTKNLSASDLKYRLNTANLSNGIYLVRMSMNDKDYHRKLIVRN